MALKALLVSFLTAVVVALTFFPFQIPFYRDVYNNAVLDNYDHWLPCSELPTLERVEAVMRENKGVLEQIRAVEPTGRPGVLVYIDDSVCEGRGDIVIEYGGHRHRDQIEEILGDHTFFGVPVRLRNV